jgi:hypothetical protein
MRFKGTLILLIIVLALGAYVYFYEIKGGAQREKAKESENQLWKIEDKNIQQIDLISGGEHINVVRKGEKWAISIPRQMDADSEELNRIAGTASSIRRDSVVEENATDLAKFGLAPSLSGLRLKTKDGKEYGIDFGSNNPSGNFAYAAIPRQKAVFLIPTNTVEAFKKKLDDLRDHSVLSFQQPEAQSLTIKSTKGDIDLFKDGNDRWWFKGTEKRSADSPQVRGMLNALSLGKIKEFFNDNPEDYADLGLGKPIIDVSLTYGKDKAIKHLVIGAEKSKLRKKASRDAANKLTEATPEIYLAKDDSRPDLFFVEKDVVDKLLVPPDALRDKSLASIQRWDADSIMLTNTKGSFSFVKTGGEWFLAAPKKKAKWDAVSGILDAMEKPVKGWVDKPSSLQNYGLDNPKIHIVLKQGANILADCSFGKAAKDGIYAQVKGDSAVKVADPEGLDLLDRGEADMVEPPAASAPKK